jgi:hypothetical protein
VDTTSWDEPEPAELRLLATDDDWAGLADRYQGHNPRPLRRCLEVARAGGATTVVTETRYIDLDYRSEYSAFYAGAFRSAPDSARRLHFFRAPLTADQLWRLPDDHGYLGYVIIRPSDLGPVGRTVLQAPPGMADAVRTTVRDRVCFFGQELVVDGVPFMQQDSQLGRCAHAAAWMCHYAAHRRDGVARRPMADFSLSADPGLGYGRPLPSQGLTVQQLLELLRTFDLPASFYNVRQLPTSRLAPWADPAPQPPSGQNEMHPGLWDTRLIGTCCRYLNSGFPVLVATGDHAFVLCGYRREPREGARDWITFIRHDDQRGPYLSVGDVLDDVDQDSSYRYSPWECLIVPLPAKLWLPPEPAEYVGAVLMRGLAQVLQSQVPEAESLLKLIEGGRLALRTYAAPANVFKARLERGMDEQLLREYRLARFSHYVWVVEAVNRDQRKDGLPCVIGEAIFDATSSENEPNLLALHVPGAAWVHRTTGPPRFPIRSAPDPYWSGGIGPP